MLLPARSQVPDFNPPGATSARLSPLWLMARVNRWRARGSAYLIRLRSIATRGHPCQKNVFIYVWVVGGRAVLGPQDRPGPPPGGTSSACGATVGHRDRDRRWAGEPGGAASFVRPGMIESVGSSRPPSESDQRRAWVLCRGLPRGAGTTTKYVVPARPRGSSVPAHGIPLDLQRVLIF